MKRTLLALAITLLAVVPTYAQTPEAGEGQSSIAGTGIDLMQSAEIGEVSVTNIGSSDGTNYIQFVIHNNSGIAINSPLVKVEVRSASGTLMATSTTSSRDVRPQTLGDGEYGIGRTFISGDFPADVEIAATVADFEQGELAGSVQVEFGETNIFGDRIAGEFTNSTGEDLDIMYLVGICFDVAGNPVAGDYNRLEEPVLNGEATTFSVDVHPWGDAPCDTYLIAG